MKSWLTWICLLSAWVATAPSAGHAQELEPRAYVTLPVGTNFLVAGYEHLSGNVIFDSTLPVEDVSAGVNTSFSGYGRTIGPNHGIPQVLVADDDVKK